MGQTGPLGRFFPPVVVVTAVLAGIGSLLVAGLQRRATHRHWLVRIWAVGTLLSLVVTSLVVRKCAIGSPAAASEPFGQAAAEYPFGCYTLLEYTRYSWWPFLRVTPSARPSRPASRWRLSGLVMADAPTPTRSETAGGPSGHRLILSAFVSDFATTGRRNRSRDYSR